MLARSHLLLIALFIVSTAVPACAADASDGSGTADAAAGADGAAGADSGVSPCPRDPAPADRPRYGVIGRPYNSDSSQRNEWEVFALETDGQLGTLGRLFAMGRAPFGRVAFTRDGEIGIVAQDDGSLGVFALDSTGTATVIHAGFRGSFYASDVIMSRDSETAIVIDGNTRDNGGGLYVVAIGCDGTLQERGLLGAAHSPAAVARVSADRWVVAARDFADSPAGFDLHLVDPTTAGGATWIAGVQLFPDEGQLVTSAVVSADGTYIAVGDNSPFSGVPQRVAIASLSGDALWAVQTLAPVADPYELIASPFDNHLLVVSGDGGNALYEAQFDGGQPSSPYVLTELTYAGQAPQLPANGVLIEAGVLRGRVLIAENVAIRQVQLGDGTAAIDHGAFASGSGVEAIVGAIGVQP